MDKSKQPLLRAEGEEGNQPIAMDSIVVATTEALEASAPAATGTLLPPPSAPDMDETPASAEVEPVLQRPWVEHEELRALVLAETSRHCCWGSGAAKKMQVEELSTNFCFLYQLDAFVEERRVDLVDVPHLSGCPVDGPAFGLPPQPWAIAVTRPALFCGSEVKMEIPHTSIVHGCDVCQRTGSVSCTRCHGHGHIDCTWCHGTGRDSHGAHAHNHNHNRSGGSSRCSHCSGDGMQHCHTCSHSGRVVCDSCQGSGYLRRFQQLTVSFVVHSHPLPVLPPDTNLTITQLQQAVGDVLFQAQSLQCVAPLPPNWPNMEMESRLVQHWQRVREASLQQGLLLAQRHSVKMLPSAVALCAYKQKSFRVCVFGHDKDVSVPDYPQQCCGCCCIL